MDTATLQINPAHPEEVDWVLSGHVTTLQPSCGPTATMSLGVSLAQPQADHVNYPLCSGIPSTTDAKWGCPRPNGTNSHPAVSHHSYQESSAAPWEPDEA